MQLRRFTFGAKLRLSFAALAAVLALTAWSGLRSIGKLNDSFVATVDTSVRELALVGILESAESDMVAGQRGLFLFTYAKDRARASNAKRLFQDGTVKFRRSMTEFR